MAESARDELEKLQEEKKLLEEELDEVKTNAISREEHEQLIEENERMRKELAAAQDSVEQLKVCFYCPLLSFVLTALFRQDAGEMEDVTEPAPAGAIPAPPPPPPSMPSPAAKPPSAPKMPVRRTVAACVFYVWQTCLCDWWLQVPTSRPAPEEHEAGMGNALANIAAGKFQLKKVDVDEEKPPKSVDARDGILNQIKSGGFQLKHVVSTVFISGCLQT